MAHHQISLTLVGGKVTPSAEWIKCDRQDTLEFSSGDGLVNIDFDPRENIDPGPPGFTNVTVKQVPFMFHCQLQLPDGRLVGWPQPGQEGAGGCGGTEPPTCDPH